jgi:hypothetical protein
LLLLRATVPGSCIQLNILQNVALVRPFPHLEAAVTHPVVRVRNNDASFRYQPHLTRFDLTAPKLWEADSQYDVVVPQRLVGQLFALLGAQSLQLRVFPLVHEASTLTNTLHEHL